MKRQLLTLFAAAVALGGFAKSLTATWELSDPENLTAVTLSGDEATQALVTTGFNVGSKLVKTRKITESNADTGYDIIQYDPAFTAFTPATRVTSKVAGNHVRFVITPQTGHKFKPTTISFDAVKVGTDGGNVGVYYAIGSGTDKEIATISPIRNKHSGTNKNAYSHHEYTFGDIITDGEPFILYLYLMNLNGVDNENPKEIGLRNIKIEGAVDEELCVVSSYVKDLTCNVADAKGNITNISLYEYIKDLKNAENSSYPKRISAEPTDINFVMKDGYSAEYSFDGNTMVVEISDAEGKLMSFTLNFKIAEIVNKPAAKPLNRGLMAVSLTGAKSGTGNLVSWRHFEADGKGVKYKLYRGTAEEQKYSLNRGLFIIDKTTIKDNDGTPDSYYRLETYDKYGRLLSTEVSGKTWDDQTFRIPLETPVDTKNNATYTPNDASYCDMDGDGEYEIILKWSPSNEKDAASNGTTSPAIFDCIKLDGTRLWRINPGPNFFTSAHTMQFIAWDFDGDGYGEFMMKTGPGTIDGQGNYVLLGDDDPNANLLSSRGKQDHGPEYITVFDGTTGAELATIPYHTDYAAGQGYWGDDKQNRSERYLAALAYLDGPEGNPSPIFARGYYSGAFVAAYDWDGETLKERWVSRNTVSGKGLWGEGAHWIAVGDCDGDGKHEIVYGSAALDHDGSLLYRTGLGHGDALHLGDFLPERPGMEVFMAHEHKPYGCDLRDAATGELIVHKTASGDTGRGLAAHFDSSSPHSQFMYSATNTVHDCATGNAITTNAWTIGSSGAGINNRIYWDGDLYDEYYDKSVLAHWNPETQYFDRYKVNGTWYTQGTLNNYSKYNPCVLGDLLGDWREEIVNWQELDGKHYLVINATDYPTDYRIPHLMDDLNYRVQVVNQNCCYNQPPHLSIDPSVVYKGNPNVAKQKNESSDVEEVMIDNETEGEKIIYNLQGIRIKNITSPGLYIINGKKVMVK